jgi:hypothetical protein
MKTTDNKKAQYFDEQGLIEVITVRYEQDEYTI